MGPDLFLQTDPSRLTPTDWETTSAILHFLWYNLLTVIVFATLLLFAHAVIPSAISSGHVPEGLRENLRKARIPMYALAILLMAAMGLWFAGATHHSYHLGRIYTHWWM